MATRLEVLRALGPGNFNTERWRIKMRVLMSLYGKL